MSDGAISQAEIDALLSGVDSVDLGEGSVSSVVSSDLDLSFLKDFANKNSTTLSASLGTMTGESILVGEPTMETTSRDGVMKIFPEMVVSISSDFNEGLFGEHLFLLSEEFTQKLVGVINKEEAPAIDDMTLSVVSEVVSQHTGSEITALSATGKFPGLTCSPAEPQHIPKAMVKFPQGNFVLFSYPVTIGENNFTLWEVVAEEVAKGAIMAFGGGQIQPDPSFSKDGGVNAGMNAMSGMNPQMMGGMNAMSGMNPQMMGGMNAMSEMNPQMMGGMNAMSGMNPQMMGGMNAMQGMSVPNVQNVSYPNLQAGYASSEQGNIGLIMDVLMEMTVELGRTKKEVKEILGMGEGTIIELDKLAGEPVDILVNHKKIAKGEVVVIDENFGVRVTEILSPQERLPEGQ
ncbi:MAG: flagellar motor switch protein FliN [Treponemataceae bacterium]